MKKIVSFVIVLGILFFAFQLVVNLLKDSHTVEYELKTNNKQIKVTENYIKKDKENYYLFKVSVDNDVFVLDVSNKFNKQKKVINDFKIYEKDDLLCISPVYIKHNDESTIHCNHNGKQISYTNVREDTNLEGFLKSLNNFDFDKYNSSDNYTIIDKNNIYKDNLYENEIIIIYDYKELIKATSKYNERINFASYDIYHNEMGVLINNNYVLPTYKNKPEYSSMTVIDIITEDKIRIEFDTPISTNVYVNGIVENKLYIFDKSNLVQYEIDPHKQTYRIVGNKATNGQYYDGKWSTRNIYDFSKQELKFVKSYPIKDSYKEAFETNKYYYYYNSKNEFYKVYKQELDNPIFLFEYDDLEEVKVINDNIYFISGNTIYRYDDSGIKIVVKNNEFKYNYENIYSVYFR